MKINKHILGMPSSPLQRSQIEYVECQVMLNLVSLATPILNLVTLE